MFRHDSLAFPRSKLRECAHCLIQKINRPCRKPAIDRCWVLSMKIVSAKFIKSATAPAHYTDDLLPEIAFVGKSNVGKSSLINTLVNRRGLAQTSSTPGRTRLINFFTINDRLSFVDLPGYGYARVPEAMKKEWGPMIEQYLLTRGSLRLVIVILDARREPSREDLALFEWLRFHEIPCAPVLTKIDKVSKSDLAKQKKKIRAHLCLEEGNCVLIFSALTGEGKDQIWKAILQAAGSENPA
jgi:GTP-binding protein